MAGPWTSTGRLRLGNMCEAKLPAGRFVPEYVPEGYLVMGLENIAGLFGVTSRTIRNWRVKEGFPIARLPSGIWVLSLGLLDVWLQKRHDMDVYCREVPLQFRKETIARGEARKAAAELSDTELQEIFADCGRPARS